MVGDSALSILSRDRLEFADSPRHTSSATLGDLLHGQATERPASTAVIDGDRQLSWEEVYRLSRRLAAHLHGSGIRPGDGVILQLPNWWEYIVTYYALHLLGAVVIQVGADWRTREIEQALEICPVKAAVIPSTLRGFDFVSTYMGLTSNQEVLILVARGSCPEDCTSMDALFTQSTEDEDTRVFDGQLPSNEITRLVFTSGTTGRPKAIMHTTVTTLFSSDVVAKTYNISEDDVALAYLPLSTNAGSVWGLYLPLETGATVSLMDQFSAENVLQRIERDRVSLYTGSPTSLKAVLDSPEFDRTSRASLRLIISSGSSCPPSLIDRIRNRFEGSFVEVYGMNEIGWATTTLPSDDPVEVDGTVGQPYPRVRASIVNERGQEVASGVSGELVLTSPGMCVGYAGDRELAQQTWDSKGWLRTGDLAATSSRGTIKLLSRKKDLIIRGGANVSPREVEEALENHSNVREAVVVGIPDAHYGEAVYACVVPEEGAEVTLNELREFLKGDIAFYKLPSGLKIYSSFPTTSMGKVRRNMLRDDIVGPPARHE